MKSLLEQKSSKNELNHPKTKIYQTINFKMVSVTKFGEPINAFIYYLVDGHKTKISEGERNLEAKTALKLEFESQHLPVLLLYRLNGDGSHWPGFFKCFLYVWLFQIFIQWQHLTDDTLNLIIFESWLDRQLKAYLTH